MLAPTTTKSKMSALSAVPELTPSPAPRRVRVAQPALSLRKGPPSARYALVVSSVPSLDCHSVSNASPASIRTALAKPPASLAHRTNIHWKPGPRRAQRVTLASLLGIPQARLDAVTAMQDSMGVKEVPAKLARAVLTVLARAPLRVTSAEKASMDPRQVPHRASSALQARPTPSTTPTCASVPPARLGITRARPGSGNACLALLASTSLTMAPLRV